jgi:hypothetical protein
MTRAVSSEGHVVLHPAYRGGPVAVDRIPAAGSRVPVVRASNLPELESKIRRETYGWIVLTRDQWTQLSASDAVIGKDCEVVAQSGQMLLVRFSSICGIVRS